MCILRMGNEDDFYDIDLEKSESFLDNLQNFVINIGLVKIKRGQYEYGGREYGGRYYDKNTYFTLFYEDQDDDFNIKRSKIRDFWDGEIVRYFNKDIELLVIFLPKRIKLLFYCSLKNRKKIMDALLKFCEFKKAHQ